MWESGSWNGPVGQWIQTDFDAPVNPNPIRVAFADSTSIGPPVTQVTVSTAAGQVSDPVQVTGDLQSLRAPDGPSSWLRITIDESMTIVAAEASGPPVHDLVVPGGEARFGVASLAGAAHTICSGLLLRRREQVSSLNIARGD